MRLDHSVLLWYSTDCWCRLHRHLLAQNACLFKMNCPHNLCFTNSLRPDENTTITSNAQRGKCCSKKTFVLIQIRTNYTSWYVPNHTSYWCSTHFDHILPSHWWLPALTLGGRVSRCWPFKEHFFSSLPSNQRCRRQECKWRCWSRWQSLDIQSSVDGITKDTENQMTGICRQLWMRIR